MTDEPKRQGQLTLDDGTRITMTSLEQDLTYGGMMEGYPNRRVNRSIIESSKRNLGEYCVVIKPRENEPMEQPHGVSDWSELPAVTCIARFRSDSLADYGSQLAVVWFQDDYAFPIQPESLAEILRIKWAEVAERMDYI